MGAERTSAVISEENKRLTAYHEGGHAIVVRRLFRLAPLHFPPCRISVLITLRHTHILPTTR